MSYPNLKTHKEKEYSPKYVVELAREMRSGMTESEGILWEYLRNKRFYGLKFKRQHPIGRYITDFYCHSLKLIIELDGGVHEERKEYDKNRDDYLSACGYNILRISNEEITDSIETALEKIKAFLYQPSIRPAATFLPGGERELLSPSGRETESEGVCAKNDRGMIWKVSPESNSLII